MAKRKAKQTKRKPSRTGRRPAAQPDWAPAFLAALRTQGTVWHACQDAGVATATVYARRESDKQFAREFAQAQTDALDVLEREAIRRGVEGWLEPIVHQGRIMGEWRDPQGRLCDPDEPGAVFVPSCVRKYSDRLLASLLRWKRYPDPKGAGESQEPEFEQEE